MKHHHPFSPRRRPPWWPENEEWPPTREAWKRVRPNRFFRRMGCFFVIFAFFAFIGIFTFGAFLLSSFLGIQFGPPPVDRPDFFLPIGFAGSLILIFAIFWGVRSLRRLSMPLDELLDASNSVAEGDYSVRVRERGTSEVRSLTEAFNSMTEKLEVNDKQRRNMLADISHELRSPITIMQGNLEGMIDGVYSADVERLKSLYDETQILLRLVDDLRTLALAESGSLQLKREPTDLSLLIREIVIAFESQAEEKGIRITSEIGEVEPVDVDTTRIIEVLRNLLTNALRYTPDQGEIIVGVAESTIGEERGVTVFLRDSGAGIESADLSRIFDRFYKSSDSGGMGLGLSIAKYLVEAHGGRIWAESQARQGTKISFLLPR
ncbi:MAG TPA: ATP-binding protein [Anaerolineales bacterium]|nr:ATP-binding protein [Anaerolineales bacterium]